MCLNDRGRIRRAASPSASVVGWVKAARLEGSTGRTLDLLIGGEYATEQAVDPQPAATLDEAKRMAQEWEVGLW